MKPLQLKGSTLTPDVNFDPSSSTLSIKGKSVPTAHEDYFNELSTWLEQYALAPNAQTTMEIDIEYMNGKTVRSLVKILNQLKALNESGNHVKVNWRVPAGADDMAEFSQDVLQNLAMPYEIHLN